MKKARFISVFLNITALIACIGLTGVAFWGCGSSGSDPLNAGVFIDSEIEGLEFQSGHRTGLTNRSGTFYFLQGETISFSVGGLPIGDPAAPGELMSPIDLVNAPDAFVTHPMVTNICRFLQTLDVNGDPDDGITIPQAVRDVTRTMVEGGLDIRFDVAENDFSSQQGVQTLLAALNDQEVFSDGLRTLVDSATAQTHFYATLSDFSAAPTVMINLGDGLTNGSQSGFGNVHQYTQVAGFAAYISYQLDTAADLVWNNPLLEITDEDRNFARILLDGEAAVPYNLGVDAATAQSLMEELTGSGNTLLDELMRPIPDDAGEAVTQLDAALFVADDHPDRQKIFTLWIGAQESLGAGFRNAGTELTQAAINAYLNDAAAGHDLNAVIENITGVVDALRQVPYAYVLIANLPHVDTLGCFFSKTDIERMAVFDSPSVTALGNDELIGFDPFVGDISQIGTSVSRALNSDNATLNTTIASVLQDDANFLNAAETDLINTRVDAINAAIAALADQHENVILVDMNAFYDQLKNGGVALTDTTLERTFGQGFFSLDGYHPSYSGAAAVANRFVQAINGMHVGIDMAEIDIDASVLPIDPYNVDADEDGFFAGPGFIPELITVPVYDPLLGPWIDCNDEDDTVLPENVSGDACL